MSEIKDLRERTHLSVNTEIILHEVDVKNEGHSKPNGFWYEVDGGWRDWTEAEEFKTGRFLHSVQLNDCNVLKLDTVRALDNFHAEYYRKENKYWGRVDWVSVSRICDGLEIAPYRHERRLELDFMWYYGWDCASGVIWRPRNATVQLVRELDRGPRLTKGGIKEMEMGA